jgi:hypothetical protein
MNSQGSQRSFKMEQRLAAKQAKAKRESESTISEAVTNQLKKFNPVKRQTIQEDQMDHSGKLTPQANMTIPGFAETQSHESPINPRRKVK